MQVQLSPQTVSQIVAATTHVLSRGQSQALWAWCAVHTQQPLCAGLACDHTSNTRFASKQALLTEHGFLYIASYCLFNLLGST